ncbi:hypothetical protein M8J77_008683 [Diaphorina citri]|nr:hypothetical protein M8J77_008683 [Diaphorina citri]
MNVEDIQIPIIHIKVQVIELFVCFGHAAEAPNGGRRPKCKPASSGPDMMCAGGFRFRKKRHLKVLSVIEDEDELEGPLAYCYGHTTSNGSASASLRKDLPEKVMVINLLAGSLSVLFKVKLHLSTECNKSHMVAQ